MAYKKIKSYKMTEEEFRTVWAETYCNKAKPIHTFDGILVKFFNEMFDHAFYESENKRKKDKSILSYNRLEKIYWIKDTLEDATAILKKGWDNTKKQYVGNRRVAFIKDKYVVIIRFIGKNYNTARFVTAYELQETDNIIKIKESPDWEKKA